MSQYKYLDKKDIPSGATYLVIGADGLIGKALVNFLRSTNANVYGTSRHALPQGPKTIFFDLAKNPDKFLNEEWIQKIIALDRMIVFICAAITKITDCEQDPEGSRLINVINTVELGKKLMHAGAEVIFISTNAVFSGLEQFPTQSSKPNPSTNYGRQKTEAEIELMRISRLITKDHSLKIVRLTKVVSKEIPLINGWIQNLRSGKRIDVLLNKLFSPISLQYTTEKLVHIAINGRANIYHLSGSSNLTYYDFACQLASALGANLDLVNAVSETKSITGLNHDYSSLGNEVFEPYLDIAPENPQKVIKNLMS